MVALFVILTIVAFLLLDALVLWMRRRRATAAVPASAHTLAAMLPRPELPGGVWLSPSHLWASLKPAGDVQIGLDPLVRAALGDPDTFDTAAAGRLVRKGEPLFAARWGTRSILFPSPVEGHVQAVAPSGDLGQDGWVVTVTPIEARRDLRYLPLAEDARRWFAAEWDRLRDFVAKESLPAAPAMAMPDGGSPTPGWMRNESDVTWDRFIQNFVQREEDGQA